MPLPDVFDIRYGEDAAWHMKFGFLARELLEIAPVVTYRLIDSEVWTSSSLQNSYEALVLSIFGEDAPEELQFTAEHGMKFVEVVRLTTLSAWDATIFVPGLIKLLFDDDEFVTVEKLGPLGEDLEAFLQKYLPQSN